MTSRAAKPSTPNWIDNPSHLARARLQPSRQTTSRGRGSNQADKPPREGEAPAEPHNYQPDKPVGSAGASPSQRDETQQKNRQRKAPPEPHIHQPDKPVGSAGASPSQRDATQQKTRQRKAPPKPHIHQPDKPVGSAGASPARRKKNLRPETLFSGSFQFSLEHSLTTIAAPLTCADSEKTKKKTREAAFPSLSDFQFETTAHRLSTQDCTIAAGLTSRHKASSINCCSIDCSPDTPGTSVGTCVATGSIGAASGRPRSIAAA